MNFRVNLLTDEDLQKAGASLSPPARLALVVLGLGLIYIFGSTSVKALAARAELGRARATWALLEKDYKEMKTLRTTMLRINAVMGKLTTWETSRLPLSPVLDKLPHEVPETMQLTQMTLRSTYAVKPQKKAPGSKKSPPPIIVRTYRMGLSGLVAGEKADQVGITFVDQLKERVLLEEDYTSVLLQRLQKDTGSEDLGVTFSIQALSKPRSL